MYQENVKILSVLEKTNSHKDLACLLKTFAKCWIFELPIKLLIDNDNELLTMNCEFTVARSLE